MEGRVSAIQAEAAPECVWFLEHPPLYTMGPRGHADDLLGLPNHPVFQTPRGGQTTYHGPGQRIIYLMLDLNARYQDIRRYVYELEEWIIQALAVFDVKGERREGRVGIWVLKNGQECKIAALGVRVQKWVTSHGIAINAHPDLDAYRTIVPCGLKEYGVTSLKDLGLSVTLEEVDWVLRKTFPFGT
jgi:lipoyl(octanoyl) transferase